MLVQLDFMPKKKTVWVSGASLTHRTFEGEVLYRDTCLDRKEKSEWTVVMRYRYVCGGMGKSGSFKNGNAENALLFVHQSVCFFLNPKSGRS